MSTERKVIPDGDVREQVLAHDASFIVQAPAGSGKTTLLASRYIALLSQVARPEEILAITFTKKAAAEMRHRVLKMLAEDTPVANAVLDRDRKLGWQIFANPNVLKIQTIDSFALDVASQVPSLSQAAGLSIAERAQPSYASAAHRLFNRLYSEDQTNPLVAQFLGFLDNDINRAIRLLSFMLARRDQWLAPVNAVATAQGQAQIAQLVAQAIQHIRQVLSDQLDTGCSASDNVMLQQLADVWGLADVRDTLLPRLLTAKDELRKRLTVKEGITDAELKKSTKLWLQELNHRGLGPLIVAYTKLPKAFDPQNLTASEQSMLTSLHLCCVGVSLAVFELEQVFQETTQIDFTGILLAAKAALRDEEGPTDLALYLDYQICHLLVDEYQDTSRAQFEFFSMLIEGWQKGDGKTFFAVGDPMQSIYRFRDADVSIFNDSIKVGVADTHLIHRQLQANFRSAPVVVDWCNELFRSVFAGGRAASLGEVPFSSAVAMRDAVSNEPLEPIVSHFFADAKEETQYLLEAIQARLQHDPEGTVAILCRARNHVVPLLKLLADAGISVQANDMDLLAKRGIVRDLMNLHQILFNPAHQLAWYAVLRSPMFGLSLEQLASLESKLDVFSQLVVLAETIPSIERLLEAITWAKQRRYEIPLRELLEGLWLRCGGVDAYSKADLEDALAWFGLIDDLGMSAYDNSLLESALGALFASSDQTARVQVMTIHRSKGLEFDHVLLPYLDSRTRADDPQLLLWRAGATGLLMGVNGDPVHDWLKFEERARATNEEKRMLYVACTRAVKSLVTTFTCEEGKNPGGLARWVAPYASRWTAAEYLHAHDNQNITDVSVGSKPPSLDRRLKRLPVDYRWQAPVADTQSWGLSASESSHVEDPAASATDAIGERFEVMLGILVHRALQWLAEFYMPAQSKAVGNVISPTDMVLRLQRWLPSLKAPTAQHDTLIEIAIVQISKTLQDESGQWVLQSHEGAKNEWALSGVVDNQLVNAVLDRSFLHNNERWVIDYKTGSPPEGEPVDTFIRTEVNRYRQQLKRYKVLLSALEPITVRTALYFTALSRLEEIQID